MTDRLAKLQEMLQRTPKDAFLLYGIGLEYKKAGDVPHAVEFLNRAIEADPGYCYAYYQRAQVQEQAGQTDLARQSYQEGIAAAKRVGDAHALSELETALALIG